MADYRYALRRAEQIGAQRAAEREEDRRIRESLGLEGISLGRERLMQEREFESERQTQQEQERALQRQIAGKQFGVGAEDFGLAGLAPQLAREIGEKQFGVGGQGFGLAGMDLGLRGELGRGQLGLGGRQAGLQEAIAQQQMGVQGLGFAQPQPGRFGQTLGFGGGAPRGLSRFGFQGEQLRETTEQRKFGQNLQSQAQREKFLLDAKTEYEKNPPLRQTGKMVKNPRTGKEEPEMVLQPFTEYVQDILSGAGQGRQEQKRKSFSDLWD